MLSSCVLIPLHTIFLRVIYVVGHFTTLSNKLGHFGLLRHILSGRIL